MIYRALVELAEREGLTTDMTYEPKPVHYLIRLGKNGTYLGYLAPVETPSLDPTGRPRGEPKAVIRSIPRRSDRTSHDEAEFLVDKAEYVFGIDPTGKRSAEKRARRQALFRAAVEAAAAQVPSSAGLQAILAFLARELPTELRELLAPDTGVEKVQRAAALFAFVYEPDGGVRCVHDEPEVQAYWRQRVDSEGADQGQCLVTGKRDVPLTRLHAKPKGIPPVSKTRGGVPLTSVNQRSFESYGLGALGGAPISRDANLAIEAALNRLLDPRYPQPGTGRPFPRRCEVVSPDTVVVYWSREEASELDFIHEVERNDPEAVGTMLRTPSAGRPAALEDPSVFYALILSGVQGRGIVRSFIESTVREVAESVDRYREDSRIVRPYGDPSGGYPLGDARRSLVPRGDLEMLPPALGTDLYLAILRGHPFPATLLEAAVRRNRTRLFPVGPRGRRDERPFAVRCSLLKAYLRRNTKEDVSVALDTSRIDGPYRLGRLLAVIDKLQQDALNDVNATIVDRYYGSASATPESVFPTLLRRTQHHLAKLRREKPGLAVVRDRLLQEIVAEVRGFPKTMRLEEQARFALGFYHQRQALFTSKDTEAPNG